MTTRREFLASTVALAAAPLFAADNVVPFTVVVTDPLAKDLSCPCVAGYGQRDYTAFGKWLGEQIGKPVTVAFAETLGTALEKKTAGRADLIIGKDSVIQAHAKTAKLTVTRIAALSGLDGETTQTGLIVVPTSDAAISVEQLKGYLVLFGSEAAEEKHGAVKTLLKDLNVNYTEEKEPAASCSVCATRLVEHGKKSEKVCGVVSSYAMPLLEGCGTINKGDLKVVGKTDTVPFIAAFCTSAVSAEMQAKVKTALLAVGKNEELCKAIETKAGFVEPVKADAKKK